VKDRLYEELEQVFHKFPKYHMRILIGDFNTKVSMEDISKPTVGNEILHEMNNNNAVGIINLAIFENHAAKSTMLPHCNFHKYNWASADGKTHNQINIF
jgi:hypothetical protein